jgi:predicted esterase
MAYYQQMQQTTPFGGVIGLSGFQRLKFKFEDIKPENLQAIRDTPCFLYLDKDDLSTKVKDQDFNYNILRNEIFNCKERFENFSFNVKDDLLHTITEEELAMLKNWLR